MARIRKGWIPKGQRETEQYFRDVSIQVGDTNATLADEEQKSAIPFLGMLQDLRRQVAALQREGRRNAQETEKAQQAQRRLETEVQQLKTRLKNVEGEI